MTIKFNENASKFESNDETLKDLENKSNEVWDAYKRVFQYIDVSDYLKQEIAYTIICETLGLRLPYGHLCSLDMLRNHIEGLVPTTILYLDQYIKTRDDKDLQKVIDARERYYKAIEEFRTIDKGLSAVYFESDWKLPDGIILGTE